jgi:hypothetical protein
VFDYKLDYFTAKAFRVLAFFVLYVGGTGVDKTLSNAD